MVLDSKFRMRSPDREYQNGQARVAVIGSKGVGKTALTVRYLTKRFIGEYQSNTDLVYKVTMPVDGNKLSLEILDLSTHLSSEEAVVSRETLDWAEAWLVVYSITSRESFAVAMKALEEVCGPCGGESPPTPTLVMGNKKDLEHIRKVSENEGKMLANKYGCRFVEVSAAEMDSQVNDSFEELLRQLSSIKGQTSPRLRKISVSKMFNNLINRSTSVGGAAPSSGGLLGNAPDRPLLPRVSFRERTRKKNNLKHG